MKKRSIQSLCRLFLSACLLSLLTHPALAQDPVKLPAYQVDLSKTSVSGLSSGAFMAAQFQVAFSSTMVGAGIIAGGPFYCVGTSPFTPFVVNAQTICMNPLPGLAPNAAALLSSAKIFAQAGLIDNPDNLKKQRVYVFSGTDDHTVTTPVVAQTAAFYQLAGVPKKNLSYVHNVPAGHAILTKNSQDVACSKTSPPYINDCNFTQSQTILSYIYGNLNPPVSQLSGTMIRFDQNEFVQSPISSMSDTAYLYVPKSCETQSCKVHVAFHGCEQGAAVIGDLFYSTTGYNEIADSNNIIVLYPQVQPSNAPMPYNPKGCWDFWGYSSPNPFSPNFYSQAAPQMAAVRAMLNRLSQPRQ